MDVLPHPKLAQRDRKGRGRSRAEADCRPDPLRDRAGLRLP